MKRLHVLTSSLSLLSSLLLVSACGTAAGEPETLSNEVRDDERTMSGGSLGDGDGDGGTATGGTAIGGAAIGGAATGGAANVGSGGAGPIGGTRGELHDGTGDYPAEGSCTRDSDCLAVGNTSAACYSPGCSLPTAATKRAVEDNTCLIEWRGIQGPEVPQGCKYKSDDPIACLALCAQPPACVQPRCDAGACVVELSSKASDCVSDGSGGGNSTTCEKLNSRRLATLNEARLCLPNGTIAECGDDTMVANECGCAVPVNSNQPDRVTSAQSAYDTWKASCAPPQICDLVDCFGPTDKSQCVSGSQAESQCSW